MRKWIPALALALAVVSSGCGTDTKDNDVPNTDSSVVTEQENGDYSAGTDGVPDDQDTVLDNNTVDDNGNGTVTGDLADAADDIGDAAGDAVDDAGNMAENAADAVDEAVNGDENGDEAVNGDEANNTVTNQNKTPKSNG